MTTATAWVGLITDHLIEACPHHARTAPAARTPRLVGQVPVPGRPRRHRPVRLVRPRLESPQPEGHDMIHVVLAAAYPSEAGARTQLPTEAAGAPYIGTWQSPQPDIAPLHVFSDQDDLADELKRAGWQRPKPDIIRDPRDLADRIHADRTARGLSQQRFAEHHNLTQRQIHLWETGQCEPMLSSAIRIAEALGYDLALVPREERA